MTGYARGSSAIAICDRCKTKRGYSELRPDGDKPGLRVCGDGCWDVKDPWRLPRPPEKPITLRNPRPDIELTIPAGGDILVDEMGLPPRLGSSQS